ncbi:ABC transporter substrate-binding protein [Planctomycetales bacterium ZRK34]|nr:ABC transporter substrate-binding protein [Planctomycetales bacterium ZRK34]
MTMSHRCFFVMTLTAAWLAMVLATSGCDQAPAASEASVSPEAITFTDDAGRSLTLDRPAERIVAGASFAVELLMALDHPPVLRPDVPKRKIHPEAARSISTFAVTHGAGPEVESLAAAKPDLVILHVNFAPFADNIQQTLGIPVALMEVASVDDVATKLTLLGRIIGKPQRAAEQVAKLQREIDAISGVDSAQGLRALALFGTPDAFYAYRETSYIGSMIKRLGAENIAADDPAFGKMRSVAPLDLEQAVARSPQVIVILPHGPAPMVIKHLGAHPAWAQIQAVKDQRVHVLDEVLFSSNPGPRASEAMRQLKALLEPDAK